jgi:hypothetical protein
VNNYGARYGNMARFFMPTNIQSARKHISQLKTIEKLTDYERRMTRLYECGALSAHQFGHIIGLIADREFEIDLANE